ncbi:BtrH N-terminal domain-containing protein [bacterium]|nr:BtrH N-terminal domain-containing protein [bacterium]
MTTCVTVCEALATVLILALVCGTARGDSTCRDGGSAVPDYASLSLKGEGMSQDSVSLSLVAAARLLGRDGDYQTVFCRSASAFCPGLDPCEPCTSWWHVASWLSTPAIRPLARSLGLTARKLRLPEAESPDPKALLAHRRAVAAVFHKEMRAGHVILIEREWETKGPHGFVPWAWAGIITEADPETGRLLGACLNGYLDNPVSYVSGAWALSPARTTTPALDADLEMLRLAVARIRGERPFGRTRQAVYGLKAMDLWIKQMSEVPGFCAECEQRSQKGWTDARDNAVRMDAGARAVSAYLRQRALSFPAVVRPCLEATAKHYDRTQTLLHPSLTGEGGERLEQLVGRLDKQKAHAEQVLVPLRKELAAAAESMEEALAAAEVLPGQVRPEALSAPAGRELTDESVPYLGAGVPLAHVQALNHAGTPITFAEFTAGTGWAFSFGYGYDSLPTAFLGVCGNPKADGPYEVFRWLTQRLGYSYKGVPVKEADRLWAFVKPQVDAGTPVLSEQWDGGLFTGYREKDGVRQVWFEAPVGRGWLALGDLQPAWVYVLERTGKPRPRRELYREALQRALQKASPHEHGGVVQGLAALEAYRRDVADSSKSFEKGAEWFCWATFERLSARKCCAEWLRQAADTLGGDARQPLLEAAEHYAKAFALYERYRVAAHAGDPMETNVLKFARDREHLARMLPLLDQGIAEERAGIEALRQAVATW